jgi:hypothetical protein
MRNLNRRLPPGQAKLEALKRTRILARFVRMLKRLRIRTMSN